MVADQCEEPVGFEVEVELGVVLRCADGDQERRCAGHIVVRDGIESLDPSGSGEGPHGAVAGGVPAGRRVGVGLVGDDLGRAGGVADDPRAPRRCCRCETGGEGRDDLPELGDVVLVGVRDDLSVQLALAYGGGS